MLQGKAQATENGESFSRTATQDWGICVPPFGRAGKCSSEALCHLARTSHYLRDMPFAQPLPNSLNPQLSR